MTDAYEIATLPKGAIIKSVDGGTIEVLMPDGSTQFISVVAGGMSTLRVVKTIWPADLQIEVATGDANNLDVFGDAIERSFKYQEHTISTLPMDSSILELPAWARWLVIHPDEPIKCITADGELITLEPQLRLVKE